MSKIKSILSILISILFVVSIVGCSDKKTEAGMYNPGTYIGTADGHNGEIKVEVKVDKDKILSLIVLESAETEGIADPAIEKIPAAIVEKQTLAVDTVSGATVTSSAIIEATKMALKEAGADMSKLTEYKDDNSEIQTETEKLETDVLIIGAGGAGMAAAVSATEAGANVIVLEKMPAIGGNTIRSGGAFNTVDPENQANLKMTDTLRESVKEAFNAKPENDEHQKLMDEVKVQFEAHENENPDVLFDSPEWHALQTFMSGDMEGDISLIRKLTNEALPTKEWLSSKGVDWSKDIRAVVGALWERSSQATEEKGSSFINPLAKQAEENGAEVMLEVSAKELIVEEGKVIGAIAEGSDGTSYEITANNGVILATGGFSANVEMRQKYNTIWSDLGEDMETTNHPGATGDGIIMAEDVNADFVGMESIQLMPLWPVSGGGISGYVNNVMYINKSGERYVAEDSRRDVLAQGALDQEDKIFYIINDHTEVEDIGLPQEQVDYMVSEKMLFKGETIEELAKEINIDPSVLKETTEKFNNAVEKQSDEFGRLVWGNKIEKGPFYAASYSPAVHHTMGGVKVDINTHVINKNGEIIKGLYAAGEITGGIHGTNRVGGNAIPDALAFGRIAGEKAAKSE